MPTPFDKYPSRGRKLLRMKLDESSSRRGYGISVADLSGWACSYCGQDLVSNYTNWLHLTVDHVIPKAVTKDTNIPEEWVCDAVNVVVCCRACNEFMNSYLKDLRENFPGLKAGSSLTLEQFVDLRDSVFTQKSTWVKGRHDQERRFYESEVRGKRA